MNKNDPPHDSPGDAGQTPPERPQHISARVPEGVSRGVFSTGMIVMTSGNEFILDFIQNLGQPPQIAARVVMPHATMPQFIEALRKNLEIYSKQFGQPPELPRGNKQVRQPTIQELYDEIKLSDDVLSGSYANGVMIGHSVSDFKFDFLTNLYPTTAVSCRVYLSTPQVPRMLESLVGTFEQFQKRLQEQQRLREEGQEPNEPPPTEPDSDNA